LDSEKGGHREWRWQAGGKERKPWRRDSFSNPYLALLGVLFPIWQISFPIKVGKLFLWEEGVRLKSGGTFYDRMKDKAKEER